MVWELKKEDLKRYPHFDKFLSINEIQSIVKNKDRVAKSAFYPFIRYTKTYQPYRDDEDGKPEKKTRLIRYASRRDAYIYSYYRHLISEKYEPRLLELGLSDSVIAYRKIPVLPGTTHGKCNINFAKDAFDFIQKVGNCSVVVLDISKYFESLDHGFIEKIWRDLFGFTELPADHAAVFRNITQYRIVDRDVLYERLGITGEKIKKGKKVKGYLVPFKEMNTQICSPKDFREKVAGNSPRYSNIIVKHELNYGIPQGAPISDIVANFYLIDFDIAIKSYIEKCGGLYMRYSDDILVVVPGSAKEGQAAREFIRSKIKLCGERLQIKETKCSLVDFTKNEVGSLDYQFVEGEKGKNGLEYLGFRFDGKNVYLRDQTLSGFYRKITLALRHQVRGFVARYPGKDFAFLTNNFNIEDFMKNYGRVEDFDSNKTCEDWTFWTYARRAAKIFGKIGIHILYQLKNHKSIIEKRIISEFESRVPP